MNESTKKYLSSFIHTDGRLTVLTGAGISAESGIPTFRGPEGYWRVGSRHYRPTEMATMRMFLKNPEEVWKWYLARMRICWDAEPNAGHTAVVEMEKLFGDRFTLITQNVDGLHLRAGNSRKRTFMIHGNVCLMRCVGDCRGAVVPIPEPLADRDETDDLTDREKSALTCPSCGKWMRPHVLWFDEVYDEANYRFHSSLAVAAKTRLLIVVGTSGATNLPDQVVRSVHHHGGAVIDINIEENPFTRIALSSSNGAFINESSARALPNIVAQFKLGEIS